MHTTVALVGVQIYWALEVVEAFERLEDGQETALKDYNKLQNDQLVELITAIQGDLDRNERQKIMTICTIDVHSRDIVTRLVNDKGTAPKWVLLLLCPSLRRADLRLCVAGSSSCFAWQSQLRHRWDEEQKDCFANICDAQFRYAYEYLGNAPRLVITPLTDRCCTCRA